MSNPFDQLDVEPVETESKEKLRGLQGISPFDFGFRFGMGFAFALYIATVLVGVVVGLITLVLAIILKVAVH
jgi:hypothetical protein